MRAAIAASLGLSLACSEHSSALAKKPGAGGAAGNESDGGLSGDGGGAGAGRDASGFVDGGSDASRDASDEVEPAGPDALTIMNGVVDAERVRLCFARVGASSVGPPLGVPFPPGGLGFAESVVVPVIDGVDPIVDGVLTTVIAGDLSLIDDLDCVAALAFVAAYGGSAPVDASADTGSAADVAPDSPADALPDRSGDGSASDAASDATAADGAAPDVVLTDSAAPLPAIRAGALPVIPAGTLSGGRSVLLVAAGCLGGDAFTSPSETSVCGASYTPRAPTLAPVIVRLSRATKAGKLGLQVVNAALAAPFVEIRSVPKTTGTEAQIASKVVYGGIAPVPPKLDFHAAAYGVGDAELSVRLQGSTFSSMTVRWSDAISGSGLAALVDGRTYTLVLVGPRPGMGGLSFWNAPRVAFVENDPGS